MKLYADAAGRRTRQIAFDLLFVVWIVLWLWAAHSVHQSTVALADIGERTETAGTRLELSLSEAGKSLSGIPAVGEAIGAPFEKGAMAAAGLAEAGVKETEGIRSVAFWLRLTVGVAPIAILGGFYLPTRLRFVREATSARRYMDVSNDLDLFALRALTHQPMDRLARITPDPVAAWRRGDPAVVAQLADLEIRARGLTPRFLLPPPSPPGPSYPSHLPPQGYPPGPR